MAQYKTWIYILFEYQLIMVR